MTPIGFYKNGNYWVTILKDGTKIRETEATEFIPSFSENCDVKITDKCDGGCAWCYEGCAANGKHGELLGLPLWDTLHPYTELAINGNDLTHPDLIPFLEMLKEKKVIANMTVNQKHFLSHFDFIKDLVKKELIHGLGVSLVTPTDEFLTKIQEFPNAVIHTIAGLLSESDVEAMRGRNLKILILGYKRLRRGEDYYDYHADELIKKIQWLENSLSWMVKEFKVISFDNLAIKQLHVKNLVSPEHWEEFYMGDDGKFTFYIDLVNKTFSKNSLSLERYPLMDNIDDMFKQITSRRNFKFVGAPV